MNNSLHPQYNAVNLDMHQQKAEADLEQMRANLVAKEEAVAKALLLDRKDFKGRPVFVKRCVDKDAGETHRTRPRRGRVLHGCEGEFEEVWVSFVPAMVRSPSIHPDMSPPEFLMERCYATF